jgi:aspartyl-tRNA(Asn)/glutamyl-tRNA(Gln) amidotransferase subunit C
MAAPKITTEEVFRVAKLARLSPSDGEAEALRYALDAILGYVTSLDQVNTANVEPTAHAAPQVHLREDVVVSGLSQRDALAAAPSARDGGFAVPQVLEGE